MKKAIFVLSLVAVMLLSGCNTKEKEFDEKCQKIIDMTIGAAQAANNSENSGDTDGLIREASVQYKKGNTYLSKLYVANSDDKRDERILIGFLDIYSDDEYEFFQIAKGFISYVNDNCGEK